MNYILIHIMCFITKDDSEESESEEEIESVSTPKIAQVRTKLFEERNVPIPEATEEEDDIAYS